MKGGSVLSYISLSHVQGSAWSSVLLLTALNADLTPDDEIVFLSEYFLADIFSLSTGREV